MPSSLGKERKSSFGGPQCAQAARGVLYTLSSLAGGVRLVSLVKRFPSVRLVPSVFRCAVMCEGHAKARSLVRAEERKEVMAVP